MGAALIISLLAGLGIVLLLVVAIIFDNRTQRPRAELAEDPPEELPE